MDLFWTLLAVAPLWYAMNMISASYFDMANEDTTAAWQRRFVAWVAIMGALWLIYIGLH